MRCLDIGSRLKGMINPNKHEQTALAAASRDGGIYVELTGKTDLVTWTEQEWTTLVDVIVTSFQDSLRESYGDDPPF
jgi:hypothetical protein